MQNLPHRTMRVPTVLSPDSRLVRPFWRASLGAAVVSVFLVAVTSYPAFAAPVALRADPGSSKFAIELGKAGLFKAFGDDHLIHAINYRCEVLLDEEDMARSSVKLSISTASLKVIDPKLSAEKRAEVQKRMEGPEVLDIAHYPEITFISRGVNPLGKGRYRVEGDLKIRDTTRPVALEISLVPEGTIRHAQGEARIRQTSFAIRPVTAVGGTIKVKDEMKIVFDLTLVPVGP